MEEVTGREVGDLTEEQAGAGRKAWEETYCYDSRNRLTERRGTEGSEHYTYDEAGNLLRDGRATYTYDAFNRMGKVETFSGEIQINHYDAEGLRTEVEENGRLVQFIYRDKEIIVEEKAEESVRYIRTHKLLASDAEHAKTWYHYASDELGSITHVEEAGEVLNRYEYDAWGNLTTCEEKVENRFKFTGQQLDLISEQYYLRARYYNPVIGRFTQEDTYYEDGLNLYAYCRNNPVNYVDPSGNLCEPEVQRIANQIDSRQATREEYKKLSSHIREKMSSGELLNGPEARTATQFGIKVDRSNSKFYQDAQGNWHRQNGQYASNAEMGISKPVYNSNGSGGRLGNESTRAQNRLIADYLKRLEYKITGGGGIGPEEYIPGLDGGRKGSNYVDVTAIKGDRVVRVNTVDVLSDGKTPTPRERAAADSINRKMGGKIIEVPKGSGLGPLIDIIKE